MTLTSETRAPVGAREDEVDVTALLRAAQAPVTRYLWTPDNSITFTPAVLSETFGDGRALFTLTTINNRPAYWIIRGCSSWRVSDYDAPDGAEEFSEHVDEIITAIEEEFGTTAYYEMNAQGRWVDEETKRFIPYRYVDYPVIDPSMGSSWGRMDWPNLPGLETVPHPFAHATVLPASLESQKEGAAV